MRCYLRTLGQLSLHEDGPENPARLTDSKALALLALLAVTPEYTIRRDHLAELMWPGTERRKARRSLRQMLYYLTQNAGRELIEAENDHLRLRVEAFDCDLWEFDRAAQAGDDEAVAGAGSGRFLESLERKLGREMTEWVELQNQRLRSARSDAYRRLIRRHAEAGDLAEAVRHARAFAEENPLSEEPRLYLIEVLKQAGAEAEAFRVYEEYRTLVRSAVDDGPSEELERAVESVRRVLTEDRAWKPIAAPVPAANGAGRMGATAGWLVAVGMVAGVVAMSLGGASGEPAAEPNRSLDDLEGRIVVVGRRPDEQTGWQRRDLVLAGDEARLEVPRPAFGTGAPLVAPDGRHTAYHVSSPGDGGMDLYLAGEDGEPHVLFDGPSDQVAMAWSPDSRKIAVLLGAEDEKTRDYTSRLALYDVTTGMLGPILATWVNAQQPDVQWSPDGRWLSLSEDGGGQRDLRLLSVDGVESWTLAATGADERAAAWSPDSRRIAYLSNAPGRVRVYVRDLAADSAVRLIDRPGVEETPIWLSDSILGFVREVGGARDFWARDMETGEMRRVTDCGCVAGVYSSAVRPLTAGAWIERLQVDALPAEAPGDTVAPHATLTWSDGWHRALPRLRWTSSDTAVALPVPDGRIVARAPGTATLVASANGWRADTVTLTVADLRLTGLLPAFEETWTDGLREDRWLSGGSPLPYVRPSGGPGGGGVFVNHGDRHYESGAVTRRWFRTGDGLTVDVWGRIPEWGGIHRIWSVVLLTAAEPLPEPRPLVDAFLSLRADLWRPRISLDAGGVWEEVPFVEPGTAWHRYTLQLRPDGTVDLLVDGRLVRRRQGFVAREAIPDSLRVGLGERSMEIEIQHGPLRVYEGLVYDFMAAYRTTPTHLRGSTP